MALETTCLCEKYPYLPTPTIIHYRMLIPMLITHLMKNMWMNMLIIPLKEEEVGAEAGQLPEAVGACHHMHTLIMITPRTTNTLLMMMTRTIVDPG